MVEHEPVVLPELTTVARGLEDGTAAQRQLERRLERRATAGVPLREHASPLVEQRERAPEVAAHDRQERLHAAALEHGLREALVHLERPRQALELLVREPRAGGLRDRHERHLVRHADDGEAERVRLLHERRRDLREAEPQAEAEPREPVLREPAQVGALRRRELADAETGREEQLAALEKRGRIVQLGDVEPGHLVGQTVRAGGDGEAEALELGDVANGQHSDIRAKARLAQRRLQAAARPTRRERVRRRVQNEAYDSSPSSLARRAGSWDGLRRGVAGSAGQRPRRRGAAASYVARGVSTPPLVVERAEGARHRGRRRPGVHRLRRRARLPEPRPRSSPPAVAAIHDAGRPLPAPVLHGRDVRAVHRGLPAARRALAVRGDEQRSLLVNSGAEAVENAVKIARAATGRPAVDRLRQRLPRPHAPDDDDDLEGRRTGAASARSRPRSTARRRRTRTAASTPTQAIAGLELLFQREVDPESVACVVLEPVQGEGGFIVDAGRLPARAPRASATEHGILYVDDEVQSGVGRTGPVWAIEHYGVEPDLLVSGKSLGGGLPLAAVTGRAEVMDASGPGGLGGTFGGNPLACAAACVVLDEVATPDVPRSARSSSARGSARGSTRWPSVCRRSARCAGSARCSRSSSCATGTRRSRRRSSRRRRRPARSSVA